ncbi:hypothetical protein BDFG_04116 [Blastomyces dermatitidis ATCC 26199]|nr:hypothetical protein BDFG_04116 [Blastomyces dermatitidis ATCC 26199]
MLSLSTLLLPFLSNLSLPPPQTIGLVNVSLPLLVLSERYSFYPGSYIFKLLSSAAFLGGPLYYLAPSSSPWQWQQLNPYHLRIAAGLVFSAIGDFCLIPTRTEYYDKHIGPLVAYKKKDEAEEEKDADEPKKLSTSFQAGVGAFAAAHVAYILAFLKTAPPSPGQSSPAPSPSPWYSPSASASSTRPKRTRTTMQIS